MAQNRKPTGRQPATKFAHLRKKMQQTRIKTNVQKTIVHKSGNR